MSKECKEMLVLTLISIIMSLLCGKSIYFHLFIFIFSYVLSQKNIVEKYVILYFLYLLNNFYLIASSEKPWEERAKWVLCTCQGWYLGLNYTHEKKLYSIIGKIVSVVWLNYLFKFDILSPNFIVYMPVLVSKL